jgi:hypothetical protein
MDMSSSAKTRLLRRVLRELARHFDLVPMGEHAASLRARASLPELALPAGAPGGR